MSSTDSDWRIWAKADPYFAVLTHPQFKGGGARADFLARGEASVAVVLERLKAAFGPLSTHRALEFGSGVGRLSLPLARRYGEVVGVDISDDMLDEARTNCQEAGLGNAQFVLSDDTLSRARGRFDLILSLITLQHLPAKRGLKVIDNMLDRLAPGGAIYIDVPIHNPKPVWLRRLGYAFNRAKHLGGLGLPPMQMNEYPLALLIQRFHDHGIDQTLVHYANHGGPIVAGLGGRKAA